MGKGPLFEACYTCRRRRIQCDRTGSPCAKCTAGGLECYDKRPLRWVRGVAIRGKMQGVSFKDSSECTEVANTGRSALEKFPVRILDRDAGTALNHYTARNGANDKSSLNLSLTLEDPSVSNLDAKGRHYLDYCKLIHPDAKDIPNETDNDRICKLFIVYDSEKNPFRTLIPLALTDETLFKATAALAARHKANSGRSFYDDGSVAEVGPPDRHYDALLFKQQAIQRLASDLNDAKSCAKDTTMASIFLLIFLDLLESGRDRWNYHLEGLKRLLEINPLLSGSETTPVQDPGRTIQEIRSFITRQMYLIETLGATFVRPKLLSPFNSPEQSETLLQETETVEQSFLGCPEYLLHAIQSLSTYRDAITTSTSDPTTLTNYTQTIHQILEHINTFDCSLWAATLFHPTPNPPNTINLPKLAESYKLGAQIYGHRILDALTHIDTQQDSLIADLLAVIAELKQDDVLLKSSLWPIFVAGLECRSPAQRAFLLGVLEQFWADTSCFNGINAARILQEYWRGEQLHELQSPNQERRKDKDEGEAEGDAKGASFAARWIFTIGRLGEDWLLI